MFSTFLRQAKRCLPLRDTQSAPLQRIIQRLASFTIRDVLHETSDETGSLLTRFAKHIALERHRADAPLVATNIRYADFFPITELHYFQKELNRIDANQLPALIIFASTYRSNAEPRKFASLLNEMDRAALRRLCDMDDHTVFHTLYALLFLMPNWIMRTDFYRAAVERLVEKDFNAEASKVKFVQLCFYLGLSKKRMANTLQTLLDQHLERYVAEMSTMDLAIVANAAYKASVRVSIPAYDERLLHEVNELTLDDAANDALVVTFVKALRFQRCHSDDICKRIEQLCAAPQNLKNLQARGIVHLFGYLADNLWDNSTCTSAMTTEFMQRLEEARFEESNVASLRGKDIATFLWSCAQLNCCLSSDDLKRIEATLLQKVDNKEFQYFADQLVDSCLSLWILGHKSQELFNESMKLKSQAIQGGKQRRQQPKVDSRVTVLQSAAQIETPTWIKSGTQHKIPAINLEAIAPSYLLKDRHDLEEYTRRLAAEGLNAVKLICPIDGINIPSVLVHFNTPKEAIVLVELINEKQTTRFSKTPNGLLRLKIRLLNTMEHKVIALHATNLKDDYSGLKNLAFGSNEDETHSIEQAINIT